MIDVKKIIDENTVEELNQSAEEYYRRFVNRDFLLSKPFTTKDEVQHLLVNFSHLINGLELLPGMTILDFGAGSSWTSRFLNQLGYSVISLDVSRTALQIGQDLKNMHKVFGTQPEHTFLHFNGRKIDLPDETVDRIFCLDAFHHVVNQGEILSEMGRILKNGGIAGFSEPGPLHSKSPMSQFEMRTFRVVENDIFIEEIFEKSKKFGFTEIRVSISSIYPFIVSLEEFNSFLKNKTLISEYLSRTNHRMTNFPIFFLYKGKVKSTDSRDGDGLVASITTDSRDISVEEQESVQIRINVKNLSNKIWLPSGDKSGSVNVGAFLFTLHDDGSVLKSQEFRFSLSEKMVHPDQMIITDVCIPELKIGHYRLEIDLVSENICWFQFNGSDKLVVDIYSIKMR